MIPNCRGPLPASDRRWYVRTCDGRCPGASRNFLYALAGRQRRRMARLEEQNKIEPVESSAMGRRLAEDTIYRWHGQPIPAGRRTTQSISVVIFGRFCRSHGKPASRIATTRAGRSILAPQPSTIAASIIGCRRGWKLDAAALCSGALGRGARWRGVLLSYRAV